MSHLDAEVLIDALRRRGLRITRPRRAVAGVLAETHEDHLTADELCRRAQVKAGKPIDPSTIYRIIEVLEETGSLYHVHLGHGAGVLHLSHDKPHHHLVCEVCGRTVDLAWEEVAPLIDRIGSEHGLRVDSSHFALVGTCLSHGR